MSFSRRLLLARLLALLLALPLAGPLALRAAFAAEPPAAAISRFYDALLATMKEGKRLTFDQRYARLAPAVSQTLDLALMTRIAVGPGWAQLPPEQQQRLTGAFSRYTISNYAAKFDDWSGERFEVSPNATANPNGIIVNTKLIKTNGEAVTLNYLMRQEGAAWKAIDVYLSGTVSELATRRSEFAAVLARSGGEGLVRMLEDRSAALRAG